jgi:hypothetical protein
VKEQFWKLDIDTLKWLYQKNLITATAYLLGIIRGTKGQGWKWTFKAPEFCQEWGISERSFYRAISFLKTHSLIDWKVKGEITVWWNENASNLSVVSVLPSVAETLPSVAETLPSVAETLPSVAETLPSVAEKTLESLDIQSSQEPTRLYSDIFYRSDSLSDSYSDVALADATPTPHPKKEGERNFGFEIRHEVTAQSPTVLLVQSEFTQVASQTVLRADVPPQVLTDKFFTGKTRDQQKYDRWTETAHPALVYGGDDTPWLEPPTRTEFMKFNQSFIDWHTSRCMEKFHKQDRFQAEADFKASLRNSPESCTSRWAEYHKHMVCHAATAAARMNSGGEITEIEKQKFIKHQRAFAGVTAESTESIDPKIMVNAQPAPITPVLESVATVPDEIWDKVKTQTDKYEIAANAAPEGADNYAAYSTTPDREASDYYRQLDQKNSEKRGLGVSPSGAISQDKAALAGKTYTPITTDREAADRINALALAGSKSMPSVSAEERQRFKEQEKQGRKLAHWNALLQTGLPSVIADVERQVSAQGYEIVDGQVFEVDF